MINSIRNGFIPLFIDKYGFKLGISKHRIWRVYSLKKETQIKFDKSKKLNKIGSENFIKKIINSNINWFFIIY